MRQTVLCYHAVDSEWPHRLALSKQLLLRQVRLIARFARVRVTFDDAFRSVLDVIPDLRTLGIPVTVFVCTEFADRGGAPLLIPELASDDPADVRGLATLNWADLRELARAGVEIGSHTMTHPHLCTLGCRELQRELEESRGRLEEEIGRPCRQFAYPYGEHDERVREAAREAGYEGAFALRQRGGDPYARPRVDLYRRHTPIRALAGVLRPYFRAQE